MTKYYPRNFYSYEKKGSSSNIKKFLRRLRDNYSFYNKGFIGKLINTKYSNMALQSLRSLPLKKDMKILDVGCGVGDLLHYLSSVGFKNLLGVDPFIENNIEYNNGIKIIKKDFFDLHGAWDLIMFHHSFEHLPFQVKAIKTVAKLLTWGGICLIRIPVTSSYAWEHYGVNWVQLDAPRHFYLHSVKSMRNLADQAGLELTNLEYDSTAFQFWGSIQYQRNIPLLDKRSYVHGRKNSIFSREEISEFTKKSTRLNKTNRGDSAIFYLRKPFEHNNVINRCD